MNCIEIIKKRRSVRKYSGVPVTREEIESIIEAARYAPTARGVQPWEFIVVTNTDILKKIAEIAEYGKFIAQAKACIAVYCRDTKYYLEDGCAATENILVAAASLGIGSCWVAGDKKPYTSEISVLLKVPSEYKLISLISLGRPSKDFDLSVAKKRALKDVIHWEWFNTA
ncbi:MAG: nitroreductase family protein [Candidatus Ancaeobacter aquaticus]|nr:nitroreductase family protein [Candidatus Ancaeobacter aquaticus]